MYRLCVGLVLALACMSRAQNGTRGSVVPLPLPLPEPEPQLEPVHLAENAIPMMSTKFGVKYDEALEAIFSVALRLEALLADSGHKASKNFLVSPLSVAVAVGQLMLGARGDFLDELYGLLVIDTVNVTKTGSVRHKCWKDHTGVAHYALHEQLGNLLRHLEERGATDKLYTLETAGVLFTQRHLNVSAAYREDVRHFYETEVRELDFAARPRESERTMNEWAANHTHGLIKSIVPGPPSPQTAAVLANAVYFKGDWEQPFASEKNKQGRFRVSRTQTVNVTFMIEEFENYKYVNDSRLRCEMVVIPYEQRELSMYIIKPYESNGDEYDINKFARGLRTDDILGLIERAKPTKVFMVMPKMSLSNTVSVLEPLKKYYAYKKVVAQTRATTTNATKPIEQLEDRIEAYQNSTEPPATRTLKLDLSGITDDPRFELSDIYQQMTLAIHEKGTEAAAISAGISYYILDSVYFRVDRPFLFFIRHEATGASIFWGTVVDPTENNS